MKSRKIVYFVLLIACSMATAANAECKQLNRPAPPEGVRPGYDGPGSWGPLHGTVTLDCLTYVGFIETDGHEVFLIEMEGTIIRIGLHDYMGENGGIIESSDEDYLYIRQSVPDSNEGETIVVRFPKRSPASKP
jgi:hypothetical protein